jgi:hypothetical protein
MTDEEMRALHRKISEGGKVAIAEALERHRKLGESIAVWKDGKVVVLSADQIPQRNETPSQVRRIDRGLEGRKGCGSECRPNSSAE